MMDTRLSACSVLIFGLVFALTPIVSSKKIVYFPFFNAFSHHAIGTRLGRELAERGHEVLIINSHIYAEEFKTRANHTGVELLTFKHTLSVAEWEEYSQKFLTLDLISQTKTFHYLNNLGCRDLFKDETIKLRIADADMFVVDDFCKCGAIAKDFFPNVEHLATVVPTSFFDPYVLPAYGGINNLALVPQLGSGLQSKMTFLDAMANTLISALHYSLIYFVIDPLLQELRAELGLTGTHDETMAKVGVVIVGVSWAFEFPRPMPPVVKLVGPFLATPAQKLPLHLEEYVSSSNSPNGVVYASLGTIAIISESKLKQLLQAFGNCKHNFLFKLPPGFEDIALPENVKGYSWLPQNDILGHDNVVGFFSHGGLNGASEAMFHGVPVIGFPMMTDQWDNLIRLKARGMAEYVRDDNWSVDDITDMIIKVVSTPSYTANARKLSKIVRDPIYPPADEAAANCLEYAMRHDGAKHEIIPLINAPWHVRSGVDVIVTLLFVFVVLPYFVVKLVIRRFCC